MVLCNEVSARCGLTVVMGYRAERETEGGGYMLPLNCRLSKASDTDYISPLTRLWNP